jgi:hypothetical protein
MLESIIRVGQITDLKDPSSRQVNPRLKKSEMISAIWSSEFQTSVL